MFVPSEVGRSAGMRMLGFLKVGDESKPLEEISMDESTRV